MKIKILIATVTLLLIFTTEVSAINNWLNLRVSTKTVSSSPPEISSDESGTAIVWNDAREGNEEVYFSRVNNAGNKVLNETRLTNTGGNSITPAIVWDGQNYGVFWSEGSTDIYFIKVSPNGKKLSESKHLVAGSGYSVHISAVWNGSEYGVTWWDVRDNTGCPIGGNPRGRAYFMRVTMDGNKIGDEVPVPTELSSALTGAYRPLIVWTGTNYGIFWTDQRESGTCSGNQHNIYYAELDQNGNKILGDIKLTQQGLTGIQSVTWDGENFGIVYGVGSPLYFAKMTQNGDTIISDIVVTNTGYSNLPKITWDGSNYAVIWSTNRDGNDEIYFALLDTLGNKVGSDVRITNDPAASSFPSNLLFSNSKYRLSWLDQRDGSIDEVYFTQYKK